MGYSYRAVNAIYIITKHLWCLHWIHSVSSFMMEKLYPITCNIHNKYISNHLTYIYTSNFAIWDRLLFKTQKKIIWKINATREKKKTVARLTWSALLCGTMRSDLQKSWEIMFWFIGCISYGIYNARYYYL